MCHEFHRRHPVEGQAGMAVDRAHRLDVGRLGQIMLRRLADAA